MELPSSKATFLLSGLSLSSVLLIIGITLQYIAAPNGTIL